MRSVWASATIITAKDKRSLSLNQASVIIAQTMLDDKNWETKMDY